MATQVDPKELDLQEQLAKIRQMMDAADKDRADIRRIQAEIDQRQTETRLEPWKVALGGVTSGAALFAAAAAFTKLFL